MQGSVNSIESLGLYDGPGIRVVVFMNGCSKRCKYCHNPEMWKMSSNNILDNELVDKIKRYIPYIKDGGGVTFSGGEPLLQTDFLIRVCKKLKEEGIHIALDTAGGVNDNYRELLKLVDLVIFDVKHVDSDLYYNLVGKKIDESIEFINTVNELNKEIWIRQVVVPGITDSTNYIEALNTFLEPIDNITNITFIPFHRLGEEKYERLGIDYPMKDVLDMDKDKCDKLYKYFIKLRG